MTTFTKNQFIGNYNGKRTIVGQILEATSSNEYVVQLATTSKPLSLKTNRFVSLPSSIQETATKLTKSLEGYQSFMSPIIRQKNLDVLQDMMDEITFKESLSLRDDMFVFIDDYIKETQQKLDILFSTGCEDVKVLKPNRATEVEDENKQRRRYTIKSYPNGETYEIDVTRYTHEFSAELSLVLNTSKLRSEERVVEHVMSFEELSNTDKEKNKESINYVVQHVLDELYDVQWLRRQLS